MSNENMTKNFFTRSCQCKKQGHVPSRVISHSFSRVFFQYRPKPFETSIPVLLLKNVLTSLDMGGRPTPDFQNSSKKIISHRFRVIKVQGLKILGAKVFRLFLPYFGYYFFFKITSFFYYFVGGTFVPPMSKRCRHHLCPNWLTCWYEQQSKILFNGPLMVVPDRKFRLDQLTLIFIISTF